MNVVQALAPWVGSKYVIRFIAGCHYDRAGKFGACQLKFVNIAVTDNTNRVTDSSGAAGCHATVRGLSERISQTLAEVVPPRSYCALVDFPNYANVGDSAIWLGERAALSKLGVKIAYYCDRLTYSKARLQARIDGNSIILMQGGGNFGDMWHHHQLFREAVIRDFPNNRVVILPQSICFEQRETLAQAKSVIDGHGGVTIMVRDWMSLDIANAEFSSRSILCPDMAFAVEPVEAHGQPSHDIVWLGRTDKELLHLPIVGEAQSLLHADWGEDSQLLRRIRAVVTGQSEALRPWWQALYGPKLTTYDLLARVRVTHGLRILSRGRCVVTDRLHGYVLSTLLGKPTVLLDNSYGKVSSFYKTWTPDGVRTAWADSPQEALDLALSMCGQA